MAVVGIICEYNPLHLGHRKQIRMIKERLGSDCAVVCLMSGNFVQRGAPAILDKSLRARAAVLCGADLVLELPVTYALSSAEGFAAGGVKILSQMCDYLCFGAENADRDALVSTAQALLSDAFPPLLGQELDKGLSFPAARQAALSQLGLDGTLLALPNNILAVEYCKAILSQNSPMEPFPIRREGSYHAEAADEENPSATAVRALMLSDGLPIPQKENGLPHQSADWFAMTEEPWKSYVPMEAWSIFQNAPLHTTAAGERAILSTLRTMTDEEFEALPYGSEGLWRKLMHASRSQRTLEDILTATKSKRYTRTRLNRMVLCAFLGITKEMLDSTAPSARVLAFNDRGRAVLKEAKKNGSFLNAGEAADHPYWELEKRCGDLYGLFCTDGPEAPGTEENRRIIYHR